MALACTGTPKCHRQMEVHIVYLQPPVVRNYRSKLKHCVFLAFAIILVRLFFFGSFDLSLMNTASLCSFSPAASPLSHPQGSDWTSKEWCNIERLRSGPHMLKQIGPWLNIGPFPRSRLKTSFSSQPVSANHSTQSNWFSFTKRWCIKRDFMKQHSRTRCPILRLSSRLDRRHTRPM